MVNDHLIVGKLLCLYLKRSELLSLWADTCDKGIDHFSDHVSGLLVKLCNTPSDAGVAPKKAVVPIVSAQVAENKLFVNLQRVGGPPVLLSADDLSDENVDIREICVVNHLQEQGHLPLDDIAGCILRLTDLRQAAKQPLSLLPPQPCTCPPHASRPAPAVPAVAAPRNNHGSQNGHGNTDEVSDVDVLNHLPASHSVRGCEVASCMSPEEPPPSPPPPLPVNNMDRVMEGPMQPAPYRVNELEPVNGSQAGAPAQPTSRHATSLPHNISPQPAPHVPPVPYVPPVHQPKPNVQLLMPRPQQPVLMQPLRAASPTLFPPLAAPVRPPGPQPTASPVDIRQTIMSVSQTLYIKLPENLEDYIRSKASELGSSVMSAAIQATLQFLVSIGIAVQNPMGAFTCKPGLSGDEQLRLDILQRNLGQLQQSGGVSGRPATAGPLGLGRATAATALGPGLPSPGHAAMQPSTMATFTHLPLGHAAAKDPRLAPGLHTPAPAAASFRQDYSGPAAAAPAVMSLRQFAAATQPNQQQQLQQGQGHVWRSG